LRAVLRQLISLDALRVDAQGFNTLHLTQGSRAVLKGEVKIELRQSSKPSRSKKTANRSGSKDSANATSQDDLLDADAQRRFAALKTWRASVAQAHNLPAYVIFHDSTLKAIALAHPAATRDLEGISGIGVKKLEAYGEDVVRVVNAAG
jgi:ATP-dependent DNA helicase RecQ